MAHISLELPDELTLHVANAAQKLGVSPHSFMVAAIFRATHAVEGRRALLEQARSARDDMRDEGSVTSVESQNSVGRAVVSPG